MKRKKPNLADLVGKWLAKNCPEFCVYDGDIILAQDKGLISKAYGVLIFGIVYNDGIQTNFHRRDSIDIKAADPKFFEKLAKYLKDTR